MVAKTLKKSNGDIVLQSSNGRPYYVEGIEKLSQDVADALLTLYDPERGFGSRISDLDFINTTLNAFSVFSKGFIRSEVKDSIERLQSLQKFRQDQLTSFEAISEIVNIKVVQTSRTGYIFWVDVAPFAGPDKVTTSFQVNLAHQFLNSAAPNLPGSVVTDDTTKI